MGRFAACASIGVFFTFAASVLAVFAHISQISGNIVPRNLRMTTVDMTGVGAATGAGDAIYGTGAQTGPNTGLRNYYEFGLWAYGASATTGGARDYTSGNTWAREFQPIPVILFDAPAAQQQTITQALGDGVITSSDYLGRYTKAAFYVLIIGTILGGLALICGLLANRFAYILAAAFSLIGFLCLAVGCIIWTVILSRVRSSVQGSGSGISVSYGNALWLYWAATGCLLFSILPFITSCIVGRDRYY